MERQFAIAGAPETKVLIRVRGLSHEQRYFDEQATTSRLTQDFLVVRIRSLVDLDMELHVTNMRNQVGGIYRVAWINTRPDREMHVLGLELLDPEGEIWDEDTITPGSGTAVAPTALLECQRCSRKASVTLSEVEPSMLGEGFTIARHCETCKSTTGWAFVVEKPKAEAVSTEIGQAAASAAPGTATAAAPPKPAGGSRENREKGRAPIKMIIKIVRHKYGLAVFDICETINVSRTGVYFATDQGYDPGEEVDIIVPYHPDSVGIPVPARVVRQDERPGSYQKRVALHILTAAPKKT